MKIKLLMTEEERTKQRKAFWGPYQDWCRWFAWYPVCLGISDGYFQFAWLETIERKAVLWSHSGELAEWKYRQVDNVS